MSQMLYLYNVGTIILFFVTLYFFVMFFISRSNLKKGMNIHVKKNINGNKLVQYFIRKWHLKDNNVEVNEDEKSNAYYATTYYVESKTLVLAPNVYKEKAYTSLAVAMYEVFRLKNVLEAKNPLKKQKIMNILLYSIFGLLLINAIKPYKFVDLGSVIVWDGITIGILLIVGLVWFNLNYIEDKKIKNAIKAELSDYSLFSKEEVIAITKLQKYYYLINLIQQNKINGGSK